MVKLLCVAAFFALTVAVSAFEVSSNLNRFMRILPKASLPSNRAFVSTTITQRVDNFDTQNLDTFEQRYLMNGEFFQPGGPLIVSLGGFFGIDAERMENSLPFYVASELNGYAFYLEHRYYGQSFPVANLTNDNLRFLNVDQALADIAHFVTHIKRSDVIPGAQDSHVIVVGRHYSANLAVWFRQKYPHLALGAWASSAPVLSVVNHHQYKEAAAGTFRDIGGDSCYTSIQNSFAHIETLVQADQLDTLSSIFNFCEGSYLRTERGVSLFFAALAEVFSIVVQFSNPSSISHTCELLESTEAESPAHALVNVFEYIAQRFVDPDDVPADWCLGLDYETLIEEDRRPELDSFTAITGIRQRTYQTCTQLGWHHTSDSPNQPFGNRFPLEFSFQLCEDIFDELFSNETHQAQSDRINVAHGGLTPSVTNVIFTQGSLDPWRTIGVQENLNDQATVIIIDGSAQGTDLYGFRETDTQEEHDAKMAIKELIRYWLAQAGGSEIAPY